MNTIQSPPSNYIVPRTVDGLELCEDMQVWWISYNDYIETGKIMLSQGLVYYGCTFELLGKKGQRYWSTENLAKRDKANVLRNRAKELVKAARQLEYEAASPTDNSPVFY